MHLKPRHLAKLLAVSKMMHKTLDTETYWLRVAAHLVWRECPYLELFTYPPHTIDPDSDLLPPVELGLNLFLMVGLDRCGYFQATEIFLARIELMHRVYAQRQPKQFAFYDEMEREQTMSLEERTRVYYKLLVVQGLWDCELKLQGDENEISMKEMAKRIAVNTIETMDPCIRKSFKFMLDLDDDPMPLEIKKRVSRKLFHLLRPPVVEKEEETYPHMTSAIRSRISQLAFYATSIL